MGAAPTDDRLFRAVFEGTLDALLLTDDDGIYIDANEAASELFGCSHDDLVGRSVTDFAPPTFDFETAWQTFLDEGEMRGEFSVHRPDGAVRTAQFVANADILPGIHLSALRDVTAEQHDRVELGRQTEMLSKVFETSPVGIIIIDTDGTIVDANRLAEDVLSLERSEITDRTYDDLQWIPIDDAGNLLSGDELPAAQVFETGEALFDFEHGIERPDGETVWLSVNAAPIYDTDGSVTQVVAVISDITDKREYRRMLEQQNQRLEEYSATVSHDLRSPLSVASGWLDVAIADGSTEHLDKVKDALDRMGQLITDLRALGRYGQTVEGMTELDLETVVGTAWSNVDTRRATLETEPSLGSINGEESRLLQLFENLFRNSVEHASSGTQIPSADCEPEEMLDESTVTVRVGPLHRGFYVEDDGPGIPESERKEVFEFGYSTVEQGTGIGLSIVEAVAEAHGWELTLLDAEPHGARFEFRPRWHPNNPK